MTTALQDALFDCDWLPFDVFERDATLDGKEVKLHGERYRVLIVPPVEVIPYATLAKAKEFFDRGGVVVGYGFLPSKSATLGKSSADIAGAVPPYLGRQRQGRSDRVQDQLGRRPLVSAAGEAHARRDGCRVDGRCGRSPRAGSARGRNRRLAARAAPRQRPGGTCSWCAIRTTQGAARQFTFRATAAGVPECWDAMRNEITACPFRRMDAEHGGILADLEPLETVLLVFQPEKIARPMRIEPGTKPIRAPVPSFASRTRP